MTGAIKRNITVAVVQETTEGVYAAPASAANFVQALDSGFDISLGKSLLQRTIFTGSIGEVAPRTGEFDVKGTIPCEARAFSVEGGKPEYDVLMLSGMGSQRQCTTSVTSGATGNTNTSLAIADADIAKFAVGDSILVKEPGAYLVSPIVSIITTTGAASITLLVGRKAGGVFPASTPIGKFTTYTLADTGHPTYSVSKYIETTKLEQAVGCRTSTIALDTFATGKIPSWKFGLEGLNGGASVTSRPYTPSYDTAQPPILLGGGLYQNGTALAVNSLTMTLTNTIAFRSDISQVNGRSSGAATGRSIKGAINPYKSATDINQFSFFQNNTSFSLFAYAQVPSGVAGQFGNVVAIYMPNCTMTTLKETDDKGNLVDTIDFSANRGSTGTTPEMYITFV